MNLIADTNVWYDIGAGVRDPGILKSGGNRLAATPTSLLEIASRIDDRTFVDRQRAAESVIVHADEIVEDCETHLAKLWGLTVAGPVIDWVEGFRAIAQASSPAELENGVSDFHDSVRRTVKIHSIASWRDYHWNDFQEQIVDAIDQHIPGYKKARASGKHKRIPKNIKKDFVDAIRSGEVKQYLTKATFIRALLVAGQDFRVPTPAEYAHAGPSLAPYIDAYVEYVIGCATDFAPQANDLGDSECFLYLQEDNRFLSSDKRWVRIGQTACPSYVHDPEAAIPGR